MNRKPMPYRLLRLLTIASLSLLIVTLSATFFLFYRTQYLRNSTPVVKVYGFYEFCEELAPVGGTVQISVSRDPLVVSVKATTESEFERLKELVTSSMLTTGAVVVIQYQDQAFHYVPPAIP